ncbi:MAG: hypothetical protein F6J86_26165 [Symploca sp. SIO1B1]|nr:hypothetical protein [Symploca sp. SIO1B1]
MTSQGAEIHEFSTGIRAKRDPNGSWVSLGFTGQYMNATMPVPHCVERSIANKEFAVAEGAASDRPAIIGRVVLGNGEPDWSVVAVVSKGWDETGRSASFYRYFLCEGKDSIWKILAWLKEQELGEVVFYPNQQVSSPHTPPININKSDPPAELLSSSGFPPILIKPDQQYNWGDIHALAEAKTSEQSVSWAFNVEALEQPWRFLVIQAASNSAYEVLSRAIAHQPKIKTPVIADEQALKSAIKSLMGSSTIKKEAVQTIAEALGNEQITSEYWHSIFDSQGARSAFTQKIYSPQMVRLLLLRALVLPETFPDYLDWLQLENNLNKRGINQQLNVALEFQIKAKSLLNKEPKLKDKLQENFLFFLNKNKPQVKLFVQLADYIKKHLSDKTLAQFYYSIAAYGEQRDKKKVNKKLFYQAFPADLSSGKAKMFDLDIIIDSSSLWKIVLIVPICLIFGTLITTLLLKLSATINSSNFTSKPEPLKTPEESGLSVKPERLLSNGIEDTVINQQQPEGLDQATLQTALQKFSKTRLAINILIENLLKELNSTDVSPVEKSKIKQEIINILSNDKFDLAEEVLASPDDSNLAEDKEKQTIWVYAIYFYQKNKEIEEDFGYISLGGKTDQILKQEVMEKLKPSTEVPEG